MSTQGNGGVLSKFWQRIFNIKRARSEKKNKNDQFIKDKVEEIRKTIREDSTPGYRSVNVRKIAVGRDEVNLQQDFTSKVITDIRMTASDRNYSKVKGGGIKLQKGHTPGVIVDFREYSKNRDNLKVNNNDKKVLGEKVSQIESSKDKIVEFKDKKKKVSYRYVSKDDKKKVRTDLEKKELLDKLGTDIINKLKDSFEDKLDELAVLESELYFLEKNQENQLELDKVREIKKKISELVVRINEIIEQYNLYKDNYYIEYVVDIDDNVLMDDIINYRDMLDSLDDEKKFVKEYKALEEFKSLYRNLKSVRDDAEKLVDNNEQKIEKLDIRDKKYNDIKLGMVPIDDINRDCAYEIEKQNKYFSQLMEKINVISKEEYTTMHLRGVGSFLGQSLRYLGFMMLSPLSGMLPNIAVQTLATRRLVGNLYRHIHIEEVRHIQYEAVNYDSELSHVSCDLDYVDKLLSDTYKDIVYLKEEFMLQYDSRIPGYEDTLKKIQQMEKMVVQNQNRVLINKKKVEKSKKMNKDKLMKVKELNQKAV